MKQTLLLTLVLAAAAAALAEAGIREEVHDGKRLLRQDPRPNSVHGCRKSSGSGCRNGSKTCLEPTSKLRNSKRAALSQKSRQLKSSCFKAPGSTSDDPVVSIAFAPSEQIKNCCLAPEQAEGQKILVEVRSMLSHYAKLVEKDFDFGMPPQIPGPSAAPSLLQSFRLSGMVLNSLMARIQSPDHPDYPMLTGLRSGSYICTVCERWPDCSGGLALCKP